MREEPRMLALILYAGSNAYALDTRSVIEVVHAAELRPLPQAPVYIRGVLNLHREPVPVVDLCNLTGGTHSDDSLSTRIVLLHYPSHEKREHVLGLMAERMTETRNVEERELRSTGIMVRNAKYLGRVLPEGGRMIQWLNVDQLLPADLKDVLFKEPVQ
jgi:chemotaxis-related protein WspB